MRLKFLFASVCFAALSAALFAADKLAIAEPVGKGGVKADESIIDEKEFFQKAPEVAVNAIADACTGSNPRQPTPEEMERLLDCVYNDKVVDF